MGCVSNRPNANKVQLRSAKKSEAQLEYELNNCYEHFQSLSGELVKNQKAIVQILGREPMQKEYIVIFNQLENSPQNDNLHESNLIKTFESFFQTIEQGQKMLPLLLQKSLTIEESLKTKKKEIVQFKAQIQEHLDFCRSVAAPLSKTNGNMQQINTMVTS